MRKYPIGIQTFQNIIEDKYVYADKTDLVYKLANSGKAYFLTRPRRFGKSLLISTLESYFLGKKQLFEGLAIEKLEHDWNEYPVIRIDFSLNGYQKNEILLEKIDSILEEYEKKYKIKKTNKSLADRFEKLIKLINEKTGKKVVVLIDEYDKPILDALYTDFTEINRQIIKDFYGVLKGCDQYLKFVFLTGIVRVPNLNIFSGLNQLQDISMSSEYASICGITQDELLTIFEQDIVVLAEKYNLTKEDCIAKLKLMYDGYHFCEDCPDIYNPFSVLNAFSQKKFQYKWFESGTPSSLIKVLQSSPFEITKYIDKFNSMEMEFNIFEPENDNVLPIIYQSGYLTIKSYNPNSELYKLGFPNMEVEKGFYQNLLPRVSSIPRDELGLAVENFRNAMEAQNHDKLKSLIKASIANLPYLQNKKHNEDMYRNVLHMLFTVVGYSTNSESVSSAGRADIVVIVGNLVYIFELKMADGQDADRRADEALIQIDEKHYADRFDATDKTVIKVALVFDDNGVGLIGYKAK